MRRGREISGWTLAVVVLLSGATVPVAGPTRPLTLDAAIELALRGHPALAAGRAAEVEAQAAVRQAESQRWPRVVVDGGWRLTDNQVLVFSDKLTSASFTRSDFDVARLNDPASRGHGMAGVSVELPLDTSGRLRLDVDASRAAASAASADMRAERARIVEEVTASYFGLALAREALDVADSAVDDMRRHEARAGARVESGLALSSELLRARVDRLARERDRERGLADVRLAAARLRRDLSFSSDEEFEPVTPLSAPTDRLDDLDRYTGAALASRPDIDAARRQADAAFATARAARAEGVAEVVGQGRYERNTDAFDPGAGSYVAGIRVTWSAFDRGRGARAERADAASARAQAATRSLTDGVSVEVETCYRDVEVADRSVTLAREAVVAAEEARRIDSERYAAGLLPLTDLIDSEHALVAARLAAVQAIHDAVVGRARLLRAAGLLEPPAAGAAAAALTPTGTEAR